MGELMRFVLDFEIPVPKQKVIEIFKKVTPIQKELSYE